MYKFKYKNLFVIIILFISLFNLQNCMMHDDKLGKFSNDCFFFRKLWDAYVGVGTKKFYSKLKLFIKKNIVYIADREGFIKSINIITGEKQWNLRIHKIFHTTQDFFSSGVLIDNNQLYIGSEKGRLYSLDIQEKEPCWITQLSGEILSSLIVSPNGLVIAYTNNGILYGIDKINGNIKWFTKIDDNYFISLRGNSTPAIAFNYNLIIVGNNVGKIKAVNLNTGKIVWETKVAYPQKGSWIKKINDVDSSPLILNNKVYTIAYNGYFSILNLKNGKLIWQNRFLKGSLNDLLIDNNQNIYLINQKNIIYSISSSGKNIYWKQKKLFKYKIASPTIYNEKYIMVSDKFGYLYWINKINGKVSCKKYIHGSGIQNYIVLNNKLLIHTKQGIVYFLEVIKEL